MIKTGQDYRSWYLCGYCSTIILTCFLRNYCSKQGTPGHLTLCLTITYCSMLDL